MSVVMHVPYPTYRHFHGGYGTAPTLLSSATHYSLAPKPGVQQPMIVPPTMQRLPPASAPPSQQPQPQPRSYPSAGQEPGQGLPGKFAGSFMKDPANPQLGKGAYATVWQIVERSTGKKRACKVMERAFFDCRAIGHLVDRELVALRRCAERACCKHIVRMFDSAEEAGRVFIMMELCQSNLYDYMRTQPGAHLAEAECARWTYQLIIGLMDLHGLGILHRDIKPTNLLRTEDGTLKITDFGWCANVSERPTDVAGTFHYMAPEVMQRSNPQVQTGAVDAWSAAATMLELLLGYPLLTQMPSVGRDGPDFSGLLRELATKCPPAMEAKPAHVSLSAWEFMRSLLTPSITYRRTLSSALRHAWLETAGHETTGSAVAPPRPPVQPRGAPLLQLPTPLRMRSAPRDAGLTKTHSTVVRLMSEGSSTAAPPSSSESIPPTPPPGPPTPSPMPAAASAPAGTTTPTRPMPTFGFGSLTIPRAAAPPSASSLTPVQVASSAQTPVRQMVHQGLHQAPLAMSASQGLATRPASVRIMPMQTVGAVKHLPMRVL
eukprot:TRINITY_DN80435_c0_g1_i1.p1 TRINITY_DN80435_c0_g1~~TRINITY_DN80435_c0_g1_i1.p1  ORF type:complete len:547 (+),score=87.93 TRINITY_DN80435_c0_g1_i1:79-1719(+)